MDKLLNELFSELDEVMDELNQQEKDGFFSNDEIFNSFFDSSEPSFRKKHNIFNNYFQEEFDDNSEDDYVINGFGSLDDDE